MRSEPGIVEWIAIGVEIGDHFGEILFDEIRHHPAIMQLVAPAHQALRRVRFSPEASDQGTQQQLLDQAHLCMRRHLECAQFEQAESAGRAVRRIQLVDAELGAMRVAGGIDKQVAQ